MKEETETQFVDQLVLNYLAAEFAAGNDSSIEYLRAMAESSLSTYLNENQMVLIRLNGDDELSMIGPIVPDKNEFFSFLKEAMYKTMQNGGVINTGNSSEVASYVLSCFGIEYTDEHEFGGKEGCKEFYHMALEILLDHYPNVWCVNVWSPSDGKVTVSNDIHVEALRVGYDPLTSEVA